MAKQDLLVVDGADARLPEVPGVRVVRAPGSGDDTIVELVKDEVPGRRCVVVTADRELRSRVGALGASVIGPRALPYP
jgi:rRNA-processing protein FCF1